MEVQIEIVGVNLSLKFNVKIEMLMGKINVRGLLLDLQV